jgi:hypothetical protein
MFARSAVRCVVPQDVSHLLQMAASRAKQRCTTARVLPPLSPTPISTQHWRNVNHATLSVSDAQDPQRASAQHVLDSSLSRSNVWHPAPLVHPRLRPRTVLLVTHNVPG